MLIDTLLGAQNFPSRSAKAHLFLVPSRAFPGTRAETAIYQAAKTPDDWGVQRHSGSGRIMAVEGLPESFGTFSQVQYNVMDGTILKLFALKKTQFDDRPRVAAQFLRLRNTGPLVRLEVPLNEWDRVTVNRAYVEARMDVLTLEEAEALGVKVMPLNRRSFFSTSVEGMINRRIMSQEIRSAAVIETNHVENSEGQKVQVESRRSKRILDV